MVQLPIRAGTDEKTGTPRTLVELAAADRPTALPLMVMDTLLLVEVALADRVMAGPVLLTATTRAPAAMPAPETAMPGVTPEMLLTVTLALPLVVVPVVTRVKALRDLAFTVVPLTRAGMGEPLAPPTTMSLNHPLATGSALRLVRPL